MKSGALIICAVVVLLLLPATLGSINSFRMEEQIDYFNVTVGNTDNSTVTLSQDLMDDETQNIDTITSNTTTDAPFAYSYTASTNALFVTGLTANVTSRLTVDYNIDGLDDYTGAGIATKVWPMLLVLGSICLVVAAVYNATRRDD